VALAAGCATTRRNTAVEETVSNQAEVEALLAAGKYADALTRCIELSREDPLAAGLPELQSQVMKKLNEARAHEVAIAASHAEKHAAVDVGKHKRVPATFGLNRFVAGETNSLRTRPNAMEQVLLKPVTMHIEDVTLKDFVLAVGTTENVNIITDGTISEKTMTLHAEKVPLVEILDYVSRNLGVTFFVGQNLIWATAGTTGETGPPLETRIYRLRRGLSGDELESGEADIVKAVEQFVPAFEGAQLLYNRKAHVLIAKNIRENLSKIEQLIETLDVCPPQVLIEARFINLGVTDLRELGIDWLIHSPLAITTETVLRNGTPMRANKTEIASGARIGFPPQENSSQGMNFTYQGLLTDPMFRAVIHAIELSGKSRTLSVPRVTTVNNRPAQIRIGEDFRYFEEFDVQSIPSVNSGSGQTTYQNVLVPVGAPKLEKLGIELSVTPSVGADGRAITLRTTPKITSFVRFEFYQTGDANNNVQGGNNATQTNVNSLVKLPIFSTREIDTEVIVQSGETVVMGGLISSAEANVENKVPILSSIPLLGRLFRTDTVTEKHDNLLIFVTASIISDRGESLLPLSQTAAALSSEAAVPETIVVSPDTPVIPVVAPAVPPVTPAAPAPPTTP
jgi:type II secretory pathway component GspD/PulD (secretin)